MKIGLAIYNFDPKKGGAERYTYDLAGRLAAKGHELLFFVLAGSISRHYPRYPLSTITYPQLAPESLVRPVAHAALCAEYRPDVMLGYGNVLDLDVYQSHGGVQDIWMEREIASCEKGMERSVKALSCDTASIRQSSAG